MCRYQIHFQNVDMQPENNIHFLLHSITYETTGYFKVAITYNVCFNKIC